MRHRLSTTHPFRERLVWFWANHFTLGLRAGAEVMAVMAPFVLDAIRPHVTGRFTDMLLAVMRHPAMLFYLNNHKCAGPGSEMGRVQGWGMNENLVREALELHTVMPAAGYTQQDVTEYARMLTGWTLHAAGPSPGFSLQDIFHEPGPKILLGHTDPEGEVGGVAFLTWLGEHPCTYRNIAFKLVRHFIADEPPTPCVSRVETVLRATCGDLRAAAMAIIDMPEAWIPATKLRSPMEFIAAVLRAIGVTDYASGEYWGVLATLRQQFQSAPMPNGYPDTAAEWGTVETLLGYVDWVHRLHLDHLDPKVIAEQALGGLVSPTTMSQVRSAGSRGAAMALLLTSPEFMRR